jgi:hypothetical protein
MMEVISLLMAYAKKTFAISTEQLASAPQGLNCMPCTSQQSRVVAVQHSHISNLGHKPPSAVNHKLPCVPTHPQVLIAARFPANPWVLAGNPLPPVIHQVVKQQQLGSGRLLVVGDVHGCFDELQQLLQTVDYKQGSDNLVFVGDLVNKGPKSAEVGVIQSAGIVQRYCCGLVT